MFETIAIIAIVLAIAIAIVLVLAATKPDTFSVQRAAVVKAPPEKIFALINDFNRWGAWSPWEKKDPGMKRTFGATTSGKGAVYAWEGNKDVGQGRMEIAESVPPRLLFDVPQLFAGVRPPVLAFQPQDGLQQSQ